MRPPSSSERSKREKTEQLPSFACWTLDVGNGRLQKPRIELVATDWWIFAQFFGAFYLKEIHGKAGKLTEGPRSSGCNFRLPVSLVTPHGLCIQNPALNCSRPDDQTPVSVGGPLGNQATGRARRPRPGNPIQILQIPRCVAAVRFSIRQSEFESSCNKNVCWK